MKHDKLMKYPKRFCVECDGERYVYLVMHKTFGMYHCQDCKQEVVRAGDGVQASSSKRVTGGLDLASFSEDFLGGKSSKTLASESPDVLSDEHSMWPARDFDADAEREDRIRTLKLAMSNLTARQAEILEAVDAYGTQHGAALALGIKQTTVANTLKQIQKKLGRHINKSGGPGEQGGIPR